MKGQVKIIVSMLIFGSIGIFVKGIDLTSIEIAFIRAVIGSLFLACAGLAMKQNISWGIIRKNLVFLILSGMAIGFNWIFLFQGFKYTSISNATLVYYFAPVFVLILSPIILKEKLTWAKIGYISIAMIGLFLILNMNHNQGSNSYQHIKGIIYALGGAALYSSVIIMNKFIRNLSGFETTLIQLIIAALVLLPMIIYQGGLNIGELDSTSWIFIIILGIIHTGIGYLLYFTAIKEINVQSTAILSYIDPISAVIISALVFAEGLNIIQIFGGVLILGSTFLSQRGNS